MNQVGDPLENLRDIHLPPAISMWPPAPGWFILAFIILAIFFYVAYFFYKSRKKNRGKRVALKHLIEIEKKQQSPQIKLMELSTLLRRVALAKFPRQKVAGLHGVAWLLFLDETGETKEFSQGVGKILASAPYSDTTQNFSQQLFIVTKTWIEKNA